MWSPPIDHPLRRLFAGVTEYAFMSSLGVADPPLVDYLASLLSRFLHLENIYRLHNSSGERLEQVVDMVREADALPEGGRTRREYHRHIGDFTLFWTGLYPEALRKLQAFPSKDSFISFCSQGKRSYAIAAEYDEATIHDETEVLKRLSREFELCVYGLQQVRREIDQLPGELRGPSLPRLFS